MCTWSKAGFCTFSPLLSPPPPAPIMERYIATDINVDLGKCYKRHRTEYWLWMVRTFLTNIFSQKELICQHQNFLWERCQRFKFNPQCTDLNYLYQLKQLQQEGEQKNGYFGFTCGNLWEVSILSWQRKENFWNHKTVLQDKQNSLLPSNNNNTLTLHHEQQRIYSNFYQFSNNVHTEM